LLKKHHLTNKANKDGQKTEKSTSIAGSIHVAALQASEE